MKIARLIVLSAALAAVSCAAHAQGKPAPKDGLLYFVWPQDGAAIKGGFWCRFGLATWALLMRATIFRTAVIIIC